MSLEEERKVRQQLFDDITDGKIPDHVPSYIHVGFESALAYNGYDLTKTQWGEDMDPYFQSYKKVTEKIDGDLVQFTAVRPIKALTTMGCKAFVMSQTGYIQHPEVHSMEPDEYEEYAKDPLKFMQDVAAPRIYTQLDPERVGRAAATANWIKGYGEFQAHKARIGSVLGKMAQTFPTVSFVGGASIAPMDHISDVLRSFSGMSSDVRRYPERVAAASEATIPLAFKRIVMNGIQHYRFVDFPLHMCPFLNIKHANQLWWPTFKKLMELGTEAGQSISMFCESNFDKYFDQLNDLPGRMVFRFESGTPTEAKKICGTKHIIGGYYPSTMFLTDTKEKCVDKAKELMDIMAPGGGYIFYLDKALYRLDDEVLDKVAAVVQTVREYGKY